MFRHSPAISSQLARTAGLTRDSSTVGLHAAMDVCAAFLFQGGPLLSIPVRDRVLRHVQRGGQEVGRGRPGPLAQAMHWGARHLCSGVRGVMLSTFREGVSEVVPSDMVLQDNGSVDGIHSKSHHDGKDDNTNTTADTVWCNTPRPAGIPPDRD